jgi:hypothetical protein
MGMQGGKPGGLPGEGKCEEEEAAAEE